MAGAENIRSLIVDVRRRWFATVALRAIGLGTAAAGAYLAACRSGDYWNTDEADQTSGDPSGS